MKTLAIIITLALSSCAVQYRGKFATYSATPNGVVIIEPYYAK